METTTLRAGLSLCMALAGPAAAGAQSEPPVVHRVTLQPETGVLTIVGTGLGADLLVTLEGQPISVLPLATASQIDAVVPAPMLAVPGTYRLTLVDPVRRTGDGFVVAIAPWGGIVSSGKSIQATIGTVPTTIPERVRGAAGVDRVERTSATGDVSPHLVEGPENTAVGSGALNSNTMGFSNTATGAQALNRNTTGNDNTAGGRFALFFNTTGLANTATGSSALFSNTTGGYNTASGDRALFWNTTGSKNTAVGEGALFSNDAGGDNVAVGSQALGASTTGFANTASGSQALRSNTIGVEDTATGYRALFSNTSGALNTASGAYALFSNTTGNVNTANGRSALYNNTTGIFNTASGVDALSSNTIGNGNNAFGAAALFSNTTGSNSVAVGNSAGYFATTGSYNVYLGNNVPGTAADAHTMRLGLPYDSANGTGQNRTFVAGIYATQLTAPAHAVFVDANGQLGTLVDSPTVGGVVDGARPLLQRLEAQQATIAELQSALAALRDRLARLEKAAAPRR